MKIKVKIPASAANLGAGFDVFGLAINLFNEFIVEDGKPFEIIISGKKGSLPTDKTNLFYRSFCFLLKKLNRKIPPVKITMVIDIPQGKGLGSSATAVTGGLIAANAISGNNFSKEELLEYAIQLEHGNNPDNVSPALLGGLIVITRNGKDIVYIKHDFPKDLKAVYFIPDFIMDTKATRKLMPKKYLREDVVFSTGRVALFLSAIKTGNYKHLKIAMQDRIHQPTRTKIFPMMPNIIQAAIDKGAYGASLSGGGSSIVAFADKKFADISKSMQECARESNIMGETRILDINHSGSEVKLIEL